MLVEQHKSRQILFIITKIKITIDLRELYNLYNIEKEEKSHILMTKHKYIIDCETQVKNMDPERVEQPHKIGWTWATGPPLKHGLLRR